MAEKNPKILNKTISLLDQLSQTSAIADADLFVLSKNRSASDLDEYVTYNTTFAGIVDAIRNRLKLEFLDDVKPNSHFGDLASYDYLDETRYLPGATIGKVPSEAVVPSLNELAFRTEASLLLNHLAKKYNINYIEDLNLKDLAHLDSINFNNYGKNYTYIKGKLPPSAIDCNLPNILMLSTESQLSLANLAELHRAKYLSDLGLKSLAYQPWISLSDVGTNENCYLRDQLSLSAIKDAKHFCSAEYVYLSDDTYIKFNDDALALSTLADLKLSSLAHMNYEDLNLKAFSSCDNVSLSSNMLTGTLPVVKMNRDQLTRFINNEDEYDGGYKLPIASRNVLGGINVGYSEDELGDGNFGVNLTSFAGNDSIAQIHIDDATTEWHGLMSPDDKKKLAQARTTDYTLPVASTKELGGIKVSNADKSSDKLLLKLDNSNVAYVVNPTASNNDKGGIKLAANPSTDSRIGTNYNLSAKNEVGFVHVNNAVASINGLGGADGLMTAKDKEKLDKAITDQFELSEATATKLGGIKIGFLESGRKFAVKLDRSLAYVEVPETKTSGIKYSGTTTISLSNTVYAGGSSTMSVLYNGRTYTMYYHTWTAPSDCLVSITVTLPMNISSCGTPCKREIYLSTVESGGTIASMALITTASTITLPLILKSGDQVRITGACGSGHGTKYSINGTYLNRT